MPTQIKYFNPSTDGKIRCPYCGNDDPGEMHLCEFIEHKWRSAELRPDGLHVATASEELNWESTMVRSTEEHRSERFYCYACDNEFHIPADIEVHWD